MAHEVRVKIDTVVVAHKDFKFVIKGTSGKIGTLLISKGNIEWIPKKNSVNKQRFSWNGFAAFMAKHAKPVIIK